MKRNLQIEKEVELTLNSLDGLLQAEPNDFLYGKIRNRMESRQQGSGLKNKKLMLGLCFVLGLFLCLNVVSYFVLSGQQSNVQTKTAGSSSGFAEAYQLNSSSYSY